MIPSVNAMIRAHNLLVREADDAEIHARLMGLLKLSEVETNYRKQQNDFMQVSIFLKEQIDFRRPPLKKIPLLKKKK